MLRIVSKKTLLWLVILALFFCILHFFAKSEYAAKYFVGALSVHLCITQFIEENQGEFPENQKELLNKGYLKIEEGEQGQNSYYLQARKLNGRQLWNECHVFKEINIHYGLKLKDMELRNNKLYQ